MLQDWFIPSKGSKKLVFANHPMTCKRDEFLGHLEGHGGFGRFEINFLPDYKALHLAVYNMIYLLKPLDLKL